MSRWVSLVTPQRRPLLPRSRGTGPPPLAGAPMHVRRPGATCAPRRQPPAGCVGPGASFLRLTASSSPSPAAMAIEPSPSSLHGGSWAGRPIAWRRPRSSPPNEIDTPAACPGEDSGAPAHRSSPNTHVTSRTLPRRGCDRRQCLRGCPRVQKRGGGRHRHTIHGRPRHHTVSKRRQPL